MIEKPDMTNCTDKQFNSWFWGEYNQMCKSCLNKCKQSHVVSLSCSKYLKEKNNEENKSIEMA